MLCGNLHGPVETEAGQPFLLVLIDKTKVLKDGYVSIEDYCVVSSVLPLC